MPNNLKLSNNVVNPQADALSDFNKTPTMAIYAFMTAHNLATADTAITTQVLFAELLI